MRPASWSCPHLETTAPDLHGFVICLTCLASLRRPLTMAEIIKQLRGE